MKIKTEILQNLVGKITRASLTNKHLYVSQMLQIKSSVADNKILLHITDLDNHFEVWTGGATEDFNSIVNCDLFCKLITKLDSSEVEISLNENSTIVKSGKSEYIFELPLDENGNLLTIPELKLPGEWSSLETRLDPVIRSLPSTVATNVAIPVLMNYFIGANQAVATNQVKMASVVDNLLPDDYLIPPKLFKLLELCAEMPVDFGVSIDGIFFKTPSMLIAGLPASQELNEYPITAVNGVLNASFNDCEFSLNLNSLRKVLDRIALFVTDGEQNTVKLSTSQNNLIITSLSKKGSEEVPIEWISTKADFTKRFDIQFLLSILSTITEERAVFQLSNDIGLKINVNNISYVIAYVNE